MISPKLFLGAALILAVLLGAAGRWDVPSFWVYVLIAAGLAAAFSPRMDRGMLEERRRPPPGGQDRLLRRLGAPFLLSHWILAGLDVGRWHDRPPVPWIVQAFALGGLALSLALAFWAMSVNRFFSPVVRIQGERGHHLVSAGPYEHVRHPGYLGMILACLLSGPALGSWWSLAPAVPFVLLILRRTRLEDRFLEKNLEGYSEYATRVRFRLLPGLW